MIEVLASLFALFTDVLRAIVHVTGLSPVATLSLLLGIVFAVCALKAMSDIGE